MKQYGVNNRRRFTLKHADGTTQSFGTHNEKNERDNMQVMLLAQRDGNGQRRPDEFVLWDHDTNSGTVLDNTTLATNGYYEHEWDGFVTLTEFINQQ